MKLLEKLAAGGVSCVGDHYDDYGRLIAICRTKDGRDIEDLLVIAGWAWAFVKFSSDYVQAETAARVDKRGVWSLSCEAPWEFRAHRWEVAKQIAPQGCPIKGNISNNGYIYHTPWSRDYAKTSINTARENAGSALKKRPRRWLASTEGLTCPLRSPSNATFAAMCRQADAFYSRRRKSISTSFAAAVASATMASAILR